MTHMTLRSRYRRTAVICAVFALVTALALPASALPAEGANGHYAVQVFSGGAWKTVATASFGTQYTAASVVLPGDYSTVRLVQNGGTAAQLDSVRLGGAGPVSADGLTDALAVAKLQATDCDVTNVYEQAVILSFGSAASKLELTARVQGDMTGTFPFEYPVENSLGPVTQDSAFYSFALASAPAVIDTSSAPFLSVFTRPGTGHPDGYTYVWMGSDEDSLLVILDFTPDNTMDADDDYATVHVKTASGVKDFRVSASESEWGSVAFTYTDTVSYQHKVYSFTIPWAEIGEPEESIDVAFTAYGTAAISMAPVHRFYNSTSGAHFYTISDEEKAHVQATWPTVFAYEGHAFLTVPPGGVLPSELEALRVPLYRFYNLENGGHFYTISASESAYVQAHYAAVYRYEGEVFDVFTGDPGYSYMRPVHRFYNRVSGAHFYTISEQEKSIVQTAWPTVFAYEGIAFYAVPATPLR